jgi:hypothetical protein
VYICINKQTTMTREIKTIQGLMCLLDKMQAQERCISSTKQALNGFGAANFPSVKSEFELILRKEQKQLEFLKRAYNQAIKQLKEL